MSCIAFRPSCAVGLLALLPLSACTRNDPAPPAAPRSLAVQTPPVAPASPAVQTVPATDPLEPRPATAVQMTLPHTVSVGNGAGLSFTITEATIEPRNQESMRVVLLVQMQNKRPQAENFADENFQLLTQDAAHHASSIPASGGVAETIGPGSESALERLQFTVSAGAAVRALRIEYGGESVEVPLQLK